MASTVYQAYIAANRAAAHLITADAVFSHDETAAAYWQEAAIREVKNLAALLGFVLSKSDPDQEAA